jgi:tRNA threonylcarbamoyladenosine biosynthesis protein TsaB
MRILAIETVDTSGSVAALERDRLIAERRLPDGMRSAQSLAPAIAALLADVGWRSGDVQLVAVATGPGSFTGLRIGVTSAKAFAYAVGCEAIGVHTQLAIASRAPQDVARLWVVLDAQRGELFAAQYTRAADLTMRELMATQVVSRSDWRAMLRAGDAVTGAGLARLVGELPAGLTVLPREHWEPTATSVGLVGWRRYAAGERTSPFELVPRYFRRAAAEELRDHPAP